MLTFVVIDDDAHIAHGIRDILELEYEGCQVFVAYDGEAGYELAAMYYPNLIICNWMMPPLDGFGVLERLQQSDELAAIPFILQSAASLNKGHISKSGIDIGYLTMPFDPEDLLLMVKDMLTKGEHNE